MNLYETVLIDDAKQLPININEVMRYLGVTEISSEIYALYEECKRIVYKEARPKCIYKRFEISVDGNTADFGFMRVRSENLAKNLSGCKAVYIFASTLGISVDRLFQKYIKIDAAKAVMCSSIASALIESFCDYINGILKKKDSLRPRFSCGYGDFSLEHQGSILSSLDAEKHIGIYLTDSYMMVPVKSVTAIIGIE